MKIMVRGKVTGGDLVLGFLEDQTLLPLDGKAVLVTVEDNFSQRSDAQNRYYHSVIIPYVQEGLQGAGFTDSSASFTHNLIKYTFLKKLIPTGPLGDDIFTIRSTTELSKAEFAEFIEQVIIWASVLLSIAIPYPNEEFEN